jgi:hypothetical protein
LLAFTAPCSIPRLRRNPHNRLCLECERPPEGCIQQNSRERTFGPSIQPSASVEVLPFFYIGIRLGTRSVPVSQEEGTWIIDNVPSPGLRSLSSHSSIWHCSGLSGAPNRCPEVSMTHTIWQVRIWLTFIAPRPTRFPCFTVKNLSLSDDQKVATSIEKNSPLFSHP